MFRDTANFFLVPLNCCSQHIDPDVKDFSRGFVSPSFLFLSVPLPAFKVTEG